MIHLSMYIGYFLVIVSVAVCFALNQPPDIFKASHSERHCMVHLSPGRAKSKHIQPRFNSWTNSSKN